MVPVLKDAVKSCDDDFVMTWIVHAFFFFFFFLFHKLVLIKVEFALN